MRVLKADDPSLDPEAMSNREKTRVVDALRCGYARALLLVMVGLKRRTYYYERTALAAGDRYTVLRERIRFMFESGGRIWGHWTICRRLRVGDAEPLVVSEKVVLRLMRERGLVPAYVKTPQAVQLVRRRDHRGAEPPVADRRDRVQARRVQGVPVASHRLLRRQGRLLDALKASGPDDDGLAIVYWTI